MINANHALQSSISNKMFMSRKKRILVSDKGVNMKMSSEFIDAQDGIVSMRRTINLVKLIDFIIIINKKAAQTV